MTAPQPSFRQPEPVRPAAYQPESFAAYEAPQPQPVAAEPAPAPAAQPAPVATPIWNEPKRVAFGAEYDLSTAAHAPEPQADLYAEPETAPVQPAPKPAPASVRDPEPEPIAAAAETEEAPLFPDRSYTDRRRGGGFLGLFGGRSRAAAIEEPQAAAPSYRQAAPQTRGSAALKTAEEEQPLDASDDLEIPSFLRRLAN
jgi:cell division protein FtsZ